MRNMKKIQQFSVASSKHDLSEKPFGFCCDIKKQDLTEGYKSKRSSTNLFPSIIKSKDGGPNIKVYIGEPSVQTSRPLRVPKIRSAAAVAAGATTATKAATTTTTKAAAATAAVAARSGAATTASRAGTTTTSARAGTATTATRAGAATAAAGTDAAATATKRGTATAATKAGAAVTDTEVTIAPSYLNGTMHCKRCRGPLQWYLEDEIEEARNIINEQRLREYNLEARENIMLAKEKESRRKLRRRGGKVGNI